MKSKNFCLNPVSLPTITHSKARVIRCGQCSNCLRQRANELSVRVQREFHGQNVAFLTFTYRDDTMPIMLRSYEVDNKDNIITSKHWIVRGTEFFKEAPFDWKAYIDPKTKRLQRLKRYHPLVYCTDLFKSSDSKLFRSEYFTVNYEDIQNLLKRFRQAHPAALDKWICVPEYGGKSYRPHYHMLVMGLTKQEVHSLAIDWQSRYGHVDIDCFEECDSANRIEHMRKVSMYVAKYCCKGAFDCPHIKEGFCLKPRRGISRDFGIGDSKMWQDYVSYVCAFDLFGNYDPLSVNPNMFGDKAIKALIYRRQYAINGFHLPNPKYLLKRVFYVKEKVFDPVKGKVVYRSRSSQLSKKVADVILRDLCSDFNQTYEAFRQEVSQVDWSECFVSLIKVRAKVT